jgi:ferric-dicitrate binding protein FerR (iron transport regulator)
VNDELRARRLGQALRADSATELLHAAPDEELARLLRTVRAIHKPAGMTRRARVAALAVMASAAAIVLILTFRPAGELTYDVRGVARIDERGVSAESGEPVQLRFSDGSQVDLSPGARARVDARTPDGAALTLLDGEALATVRHRARTRWSLSAGPFVV